MTSMVDDHLRRTDLAHGEEHLFPSASFQLHHAAISMKIRDASGLSFLLDSLVAPPGRLIRVRFGTGRGG
jgi:hypothetical protein